MAKKIKIKGTNFTDNLVGTQLTSGSSLLTLGNFSLTTTFDGPKTNKTYSLGVFSQPLTLDTMGVTSAENKEVINNNLSVFLNLDTSNPQDFVQFGSLYERLRVAVEQILTKWPAGLYSTPNTLTPINIINISYNAISGQTTFDLPTSALINNFDMTYTSGATIAESFAVEKDYKNIDAYYERYTLLLNGSEFNLLGFEGSVDLVTGNIVVTVKGNPFPGSSTSSQSLHLKPRAKYIEEFYSKLDEFEYELLNRDVIPPYTATFKEALETEEGLTVFVDRHFTWPVTDGYNIDNNTPQYAEYFEDLLRLGADYDDYKTDLVSRFFVTGSIDKYDTDDNRVKKMLRIYGREFDQTKQFIDGLAFAHNVSYDKKNNLPDLLVKNLARMLGWDTLNTTSVKGLLESFVSPTATVYSGQSKGYSFAEMDIELWRRLLLNTAYLFKGKGTRKVIEFMFRFIGAPDCLVDFNEHVYLADDKLSVTGFTSFVSLTTGLDEADIDMNEYAIDDDGYPSILRDRPSLYFQADGGWYRQTDVKPGNNPHYGPYDYGQHYITSMFRCFFTGDTHYRDFNVAVNNDMGIPATTLSSTCTNYQYTHDIGALYPTWVTYDQTVLSFSGTGTFGWGNINWSMNNFAQIWSQAILNSDVPLRLHDFNLPPINQNLIYYPLQIPAAPCFGFNVSPLIEDNRKSWVLTGNPINRVYDLDLRETNYLQTSGFIENDSRLVINTKEINLTYDPAKAIECDVYDYIKLHGCPISLTGMTKPYPSPYWYGFQGGPDWSGGMDVSTMTFVEFINQIYIKFINVRNRKVIDDAHGGGYPTLRMIYEDYLDALTKCGQASNAYRYSQLISFVDVIQSYWLGLIEQVFPATVIWEGGVKYRNTVFDRQKYVYKHGIDDGSEFQLIQDKNKEGQVEPVTVISSVFQSVKSSPTVVDTSGCWGNTIFATNQGSECINSYIQVSPLAIYVGSVTFRTANLAVESTNTGVGGMIFNANGTVPWNTVSLNLSGP